MWKNINKYRIFLYIACTLFAAHGCAVRAYRVPTGAMMPTINPGDGVFTNELADSFDQIARFDIVIYRAANYTNRPISADEKRVGRIIGLGGETVELREGKVFINGQLLKEPFETVPSDDDFDQLKIPEGEYFILGDNRPDSEDSRYLRKKTIKKSDVIAEVVEVIRK